MKVPKRCYLNWLRRVKDRMRCRWGMRARGSYGDYRFNGLLVSNYSTYTVPTGIANFVRNFTTEFSSCEQNVLHQV